MPYRDKEQQREYQRLWRQARRDAYLEDKKCAECPATANLEIDHIDPNKKISHKIWSWSAVRRAAELAKCQILCAACHKKKTHKKDRKQAEHGSGAMYQNYKCRCVLCRKWKSDSDKKYRRKEEVPTLMPR